MAHYHKRSNVEPKFSMMEREFRDELRSKTDVTMINEPFVKSYVIIWPFSFMKHMS